MNKSIAHCFIVVGYLSLNACMIDGTGSGDSYDNSTRQPGTMLYPEGYESYNQYRAGYDLPSDTTAATRPAEKSITVPDSYHVGAYHSPVSPKDSDSQWVMRQNPHAYTIELASSDKASIVANVLAKAPKNARTAEISVERNNQTYYKGVYGNFTTEQEARAAIDALPDDLKSEAKIQTWAQAQ